jgi:hypothetical protein
MTCWTGVWGIWRKGIVHQLGVLMKSGLRIAMDERILLFKLAGDYIRIKFILLTRDGRVAAKTLCGISSM